MTTRRAFMQIAAAAAAPVALGGVPALAAPGHGHQLVLFEESLSPAGVFARRAQTHGIAARAIHRGDVTDAWLHAVRPAWHRRERASIAGLTTPSALFCLEQLAHGHGQRVLFHAEHVLLPDGGAVHQVLRAPQPFTVAALDRAGARWPQRLADSLLNHRPMQGARPGPSLAALEPALPDGATLLTSWIIA